MIAPAKRFLGVKYRDYGIIAGSEGKVNIYHIFLVYSRWKTPGQNLFLVEWREIFYTKSVFVLANI
ncbi:MAG: hypothetical protein HYR70_12360 [Chloroflexi bacterium]|nr:hypothetical protein [Chloroflexota bacterium]MBI3339424.1 hypothetical protein [Chloroflexota bacterium]